MSKLYAPKLPDANGQPVFIRDLVRYLSDFLAQVQRQLNAISESSITAKYNALTSAPTAGSFQQGDFIPNSAPTEQGAAGSKYVVTGWICTAAGSPGTWAACRSLTGN